MKTFSADSISMKFGHQQILAGVYMEASAGDIIGIVGRNGSGKSTLYKCLMGLYRTSHALLRIDGRPVPTAEAIRSFAYLPQESYLPRDLRVQRSIRLAMGKAGVVSAFRTDSRAGPLVERKGRSLSVGELRYVECLIALSIDRPVILLDEPFSQIEPIYCEVLSERIREAARTRVVLVTDHLYGNVQRVAHRLKVLLGGTLHDVENTRDALTRYGYLS